MGIDKQLNLLSEQQYQMVEDGNIQAYMGLCMREAALLRERSKDIEDFTTKALILAAADEAMSRALRIGAEMNVI